MQNLKQKCFFDVKLTEKLQVTKSKKAKPEKFESGKKKGMQEEKQI